VSDPDRVKRQEADNRERVAKDDPDGWTDGVEAARSYRGPRVPSGLSADVDASGQQQN